MGRLVKELQITKGLVVLLDEEDYEYFNQWTWHTTRTYGGKYYAKREERCPLTGRKKAILLHREIMKAPKGMDVDHINRNTLDNRKENLRLATRSQNRGNLPRSRNNTTGYRGVSYYNYPQTRKKPCWHASIGVNGTKVNLGYFKTAEEAAKAYDEAALKHFGEFATLNFPKKIA